MEMPGQPNSGPWKSVRRARPQGSRYDKDTTAMAVPRNPSRSTEGLPLISFRPSSKSANESQLQCNIDDAGATASFETGLAV